MDRRVVVLSTLFAAVSAATCLHAAVAATHCNPDGAVASNPVKPRSAVAPTGVAAVGGVAPMSAVVSSASTRAGDDAPAPVRDKLASTTTSGTSTGGGAGGSDDGLSDAGTPPGVRKRGLHWQSFLPGMIK